MAGPEYQPHGLNAIAATSSAVQVRNGTRFTNLEIPFPLGNNCRRITARMKLLPALSAIPLRHSTSQEARDDCNRIQPAFATGIFKRLPAAAVVDSQLLKHGQRFWVLDEPVGNRRITITVTVRHRIGSFGGKTRIY
jgi:hypothetical protein